MSNNEQFEIGVLQGILERLSTLDDGARVRILQAVSTFYGLNVQSQRMSVGKASSPGSSVPGLDAPFSDRTDITPKQFMLSKEPRTDVERVACIAFYLTHYRDMPHFKTSDISQLNTDAAQSKFSNTSFAVNNATNTGYLVSAAKGARQLSAFGEQYVQALPDRDAAKAVQDRFRKQRTRRVKRPKVRKTA